MIVRPASTTLLLILWIRSSELRHRFTSNYISQLLCGHVSPTAHPGDCYRQGPGTTRRAAGSQRADNAARRPGHTAVRRFSLQLLGFFGWDLASLYKWGHTSGYRDCVYLVPRHAAASMVELALKRRILGAKHGFAKVQHLTSIGYTVESLITTIFLFPLQLPLL